MLIWFIEQFAPLLEQVELHSAGDSRSFLTARVALASLSSFLLAILFGPLAIRWLKSRFTERIASASQKLNEIQAGKAKTPTMGGMFIVLAIVLSVCCWGDFRSPYVPLGLFVVISFAILGGVDDWVKLSTKHNGMTVRQKFAVQCGIALVASTWLYYLQKPHESGLDLIWPFGNAHLYLGGGFIVWSLFVMVGSSNAVNLTDGLDGLASGCMVFAGAAFVGLTYLAGHSVLSDYLSIPFIPGSGEVSVILGAMVGAILGFLWFNCYPAQVFMGDTGSLPLGALLALGALVTRQEVLLVIIGGIFVIETLSVMLQVFWFKRTGKRIFACSPLHNHYLFKGQHEIKIVVRFWIGSALLAIAGVTSLKIL